MELAALRISLRYGAGDLQWFRRLPKEDQALMLALYQLDAPAPALTALEKAQAAAETQSGRRRGRA